MAGQSLLEKTMANVRLNNEHRHYLKGVMKTTVDVPTEKKALDDARAKLEPLVRKMIEDRFPQKDMVVLKKYSTAGWAYFARMQLTAGGVVQFQFFEPRKDAYGRVQPVSDEEAKEHNLRLEPNSNNSLYLADGKTTDAYAKYDLSHTAYAKALNAKYRDYGALIDASTTLEQIEEVWPEAGKMLRKRIEATLPVVLSDEVMERIKADSKTRKKVEGVEVSTDFERRPSRRVTREIEQIDESFESYED
jgi:hypothetical protein